MKAPGFWRDKESSLGVILSPLGWAYATATAWRLSHSDPWHPPVPVICVGNLTAGGTGKTPIVRDIVRRLIAAGRHPYILSRGYGGREMGPLRVDAAKHTAADVGDEPLLLAQDAPCWISANRAAGACAMVTADAGTIVMDDGLQNVTLAQDLRLVVADGAVGFGNERAIPAGPLRETVEAGLSRAHALIVVGEDKMELTTRFAKRVPVLQASLKPRDSAWLEGARVLGFAGIGRPEKFIETLRETGVDLAAFQGFPDHYPYGEDELLTLAREAERRKAQLVTTEKDWVRFTPEWRERIRPVPMTLQWQDESAIDALLAKVKAGA